jgi:hypothetical protein
MLCGTKSQMKILVGDGHDCGLMAKGQNPVP